MTTRQRNPLAGAATQETLCSWGFMSTGASRAAAPAVLVVLGVILLATASPGIFTIDEDSYIATIVGLRDGSFKVPATAGLPPSPELYSFDPAAMWRQVTTTPVGPNTPPLYAVFALPFSLFGLRGLIALQVISFVVCAWLVFRYTQRETARTDIAWLALAAFVLGSYSLEYAQGIWPHMLAAALVMGAIELTARLRAELSSGRRLFLVAALAGVCAGAAAGVRYQNIVIAGTIGLTLLWNRRRALVLAGYVLGCALPLATSAAMNASRIDSWNPVSKGPGYMAVPGSRFSQQGLDEAFTSTYGRLVDYSVWPAQQPDALGTVTLPKAPSGAMLVLGEVKKALLQSAPWAILPLLAMVAAWVRRWSRDIANRRDQFRGFSMIVSTMIGAFALHGLREDGWCFNQRYLLELMPIMAVTLAMSLAEWTPRWREIGAGAAAGALLSVSIHLVSDDLGRQIAIMKVPLLIAATLAEAWVLARSHWRSRNLVFAVTLGLSLGWAATVHLTDDLSTSRALRERNRQKLDAFRDAVPANRPAAVFAYFGMRDAYGPLLLERDVVIVDPWVDGGRDAPALLTELLNQGRAVYIDLAMPREVLVSLVKHRRGARVEGMPGLVEILR